jgi:hypothetical protein
MKAITRKGSPTKTYTIGFFPSFHASPNPIKAAGTIVHTSMTKSRPASDRAVSQLVFTGTPQSEYQSTTDKLSVYRDTRRRDTAIAAKTRIATIAQISGTVKISADEVAGRVTVLVAVITS